MPWPEPVFQFSLCLSSISLGVGGQDASGAADTQSSAEQTVIPWSALQASFTMSEKILSFRPRW